MESYRKIAIGDDLKTAMFYAVGGKIKGFTISDIVFAGDKYKIYIKKGEVKQVWRVFPERIVSMAEEFIIEI